MGALFSRTCYPSESDAVSAYFGSVGPHSTAGSTSYLQEFINVSGVWKIQRYSIASDGSTLALPQSTAPVPSFPPCDPLEALTDGMIVGWGIAFAMIAAWVVKNLRRGL